MSMLTIVYKDNGRRNSITLPNDENKDEWELLSMYVPDLYEALIEMDILDVRLVE